ncbi:hypothetical protein B0O99DRAFT_636628 [Bisporella sp. PMI_857]|nr:hypothetical protein B0O99DRAFT_636628 [Bisporella sp. PMI_857]
MSCNSAILSGIGEASLVLGRIPSIITIIDATSKFTRQSKTKRASQQISRSQQRNSPSSRSFLNMRKGISATLQMRR